VVFVRFVTLGGDGAADPVVGGTPNGLELVGMDRRNTTATVPTTGHAYSVIPITLAASATAPRINLATQALFGFDATVWTDMPNALTEIFGTTTNRRAQNFKNFATRWVSASWDLSVAGSANAKFGMQWSLDGGTVWNYADLSANPNGAINGTGCRFFSPWGTAFNMSFFNSANAATALRRWVGLGGDGVADPALTVSNDIVNFYLIDPNGIV
jgi:hypothetical protein